MLKIIYHFKNSQRSIFSISWGPCLCGRLLQWSVPYCVLYILTLRKGRVDDSEVPVPAVRRNVAWTPITRLLILSSTFIYSYEQNTPKGVTWLSIIPSLLRLLSEHQRSFWVICYLMTVLWLSALDFCLVGKLSFEICEFVKSEMLYKDEFWELCCGWTNTWRNTVCI